MTVVDTSNVTWDHDDTRFDTGDRPELLPLRENLTFSPDNTHDIGLTDTFRPRNLNLGGVATVAGGLHMTGGGATFDGPLVANGHVTLSQSASVAGWMRVAGGLATDNGHLYFRSDNGVVFYWEGTYLRSNVSLATSGNLQVDGGTVTLNDASWQRWNAGQMRSTGPVIVGGVLNVDSRLSTNGHDWSWSNNLGGDTYSNGRMVLGAWDLGRGNSFSGELDISGNITVHGGQMFMEGSRAVQMWWRGDLVSIYFPYGNGIYAEGTSNFGAIHSRGGITAAGYIYCSHLNTTADVQGVAPGWVAGQNGDGFLRWYPKALFDSIGTPYRYAGTAFGEVASDGLWRNQYCSIAGWDTGDRRLRVPAGHGGYLCLTIHVEFPWYQTWWVAGAFRLLVNGTHVTTAGSLTWTWGRQPANAQTVNQKIYGSWTGLWPAGTILELQFGHDAQYAGVQHDGGDVVVQGLPISTQN